MGEESALEELKEDYEKFKKIYKLPEFRQLNEDFDIEKVAQNETDFVLREVRRHMMDKIIAYLRFIEMLLNPSDKERSLLFKRDDFWFECIS